MTENDASRNKSFESPKKHFDDLLTYLTKDVQELEKIAIESNNQIDRRSFVRGAFAYVEGANFSFKTLILDSSIKKLTPEQIMILKEEAYDLKDNGEIKKTTLKLQTLPNIKFTFKVFAEVFGVENLLDTSSLGWQNLVKALKIRHRLVHPKSSADGIVTDEDMEIVISGYQYFGVCMARSFILAVIKTSKELEEIENLSDELASKVDLADSLYRSTIKK